MMQERLRTCDFTQFPRLDKKQFKALEEMLGTDVPKLLALIPEEAATIAPASVVVGADPTPFAVMKVGGATELSVYQSQWFVAPNPEEYRDEFVEIGPNPDGKLTSQKARAKMV